MSEIVFKVNIKVQKAEKPLKEGKKPSGKNKAPERPVLIRENRVNLNVMEYLNHVLEIGETDLLLGLKALVENKTSELQYILMSYAKKNSDKQYGIDENIARDFISLATGKRIVTHGLLPEKLETSYELMEVLYKSSCLL